MLFSSLRSERAIQVNIQIMRVFTRIRQLVSENSDLKEEFERFKSNTDQKFDIVFQTLDQLLTIEEEPKQKIGF
ncbi:MAG: hypothetical protein GY866_07980 [Proteobacteria bacterium]|nr:hypothetical protein [Pseudomonadota bacterium]